MTTWRQEVAAETAAIEEVNAITAVMTWRVVTDDRGSVEPATETEYVSNLKVRTLKELDFRLIDGKNYQTGDCVSVTAFLNYQAAWQEHESELSEARPFEVNYGIEAGVDYLSIGGKIWVITRVLADGMMDDEDGTASPAKLTFYLREEK